jgi:hypothetical protein
METFDGEPLAHVIASFHSYAKLLVSLKAIFTLRVVLMKSNRSEGDEKQKILPTSLFFRRGSSSSYIIPNGWLIKILFNEMTR